MAAERLLIVRPGAIGDALLASPALAALRRARPGGRIELMAHPAVGSLLRAAGLIDRFLSRDGPEADALYAPSPRQAVERLGRLDAAVLWSADPDGVAAANLAALGADPLIVTPARPAEGRLQHVAQYLVQTLAPLGCDTDRWEEVQLALLSPARAAERRGPLVVIHLGSGSARKNWPAERFASLARALHAEAGADLALVSGPADDAARAAFTREVAVPFVEWSGRPLKELAGYLAACDLYVGNDSGISHLAGLCGARVLVLFGPTDPRLWRPLGRRVVIRQAAALAELSVDLVLRDALRLLRGRGG